MSTPSLRDALADLVEAGTAAGLPDGVARTEGERLSATVAEGSMPGAAQAWAEAVGSDEPREFFTAASAGRRWRSAPTDALRTLAGGPHAVAYAQALAAVATAAATLGTPGPHVAPGAAATAAVQLSAAAGAAPPLSTTAVPASDAARAVTDQLDALNPLDPAGLMDRLTRAASGLTAMRPDLPQPQVPTFEGILAALGRGTGPVVSPPAGSEPTVAVQPSPTGQPAEGSATQAAAATDAAAAEAAEAEPEKTLAELLAELDGLIGLDRVKAEVRRQVELLRVERLRVEAGLTSPTLTRHLVFVGTPGTGKTTVARLVSGIYRALGLLSKGHLVEVDRSELVAGYLGQTAIKTAEVAASAVGGVLFIDEAYALTQSSGASGADSYGQEAVNTLVKEMEDHRDDLVVIVAGYPVPMAEFVAANPGLESRFSTAVHFEDYTDDELRGIFEVMAGAADFTPTPEAVDRVEEICSVQLRGPSFGNARFVRNLLDGAIARHAWRLREVEAPTIDELRTLLPEDLVADDAEHTTGSEAADPIIVSGAQTAADTLADEPEEHT